MTTACGLLAYALLAVALWHARMDYSPLSLALVLAALLIILLGAWEPWPRSLTSRRRAVLTVTLGAIAIGGASWLAAAPPTYFLVSISPEPGRFLVSLTGLGVLASSYLWRAFPWPRLRWALIFAIYFQLGAWAIISTPSSRVDVWHFQQEACRMLLAGQNPYAAQYPNIYADDASPRYGPGILSNGYVQSFPYPPLSLLATLPGYLVGDVRWSVLLAIAGVSACMVGVGRKLGLPAGHWSELVAIAILCDPVGWFVLAGSWTEPLLALAAGLTVWSLVAGGGTRLGAAMAATIAVKQYGILWAVSALRKGELTGRVVKLAGILVALTLLPFLFWDARALWRGVVEFQLASPFRDDALSVLVAIKHATGYEPPAILGFVAAAIAFFLVCGARWKRVTRLSNRLLGAAAVCLSFFVFNKQAFANYYWFVETLVALAIVVSVGEATTPRQTISTLT
jgi:hypothetical protein